MTETFGERAFSAMPAIKRQVTINKALILDPAGRIRQLSDHGSSVAIDKDVPVKRYFRSGSEMERQVWRGWWVACGLRRVSSCY